MTTVMPQETSDFARLVELYASTIPLGSFARAANRVFDRGFTSLPLEICRDLETVMVEGARAIRAGEVEGVHSAMELDRSQYVDNARTEGQFERSWPYPKSPADGPGEFSRVKSDEFRDQLRNTCAQLDAMALDFMAVWHANGLIDLSRPDSYEREGVFETRMNLYDPLDGDRDVKRFFTHNDKCVAAFVVQTAPGLILVDGNRETAAPAGKLLVVRGDVIPGLPEQDGLPTVRGMDHYARVAPNVARDVFVRNSLPSRMMALDRARALETELALNPRGL